jgi:hypothetical protein
MQKLHLVTKRDKTLTRLSLTTWSEKLLCSISLTCTVRRESLAILWPPWYQCQVWRPKHCYEILKAMIDYYLRQAMFGHKVQKQTVRGSKSRWYCWRTLRYNTRCLFGATLKTFQEHLHSQQLPHYWRWNIGHVWHIYAMAPWAINQTLISLSVFFFHHNRSHRNSPQSLQHPHPFDQQHLEVAKTHCNTS